MAESQGWFRSWAIRSAWRVRCSLCITEDLCSLKNFPSPFQTAILLLRIDDIVSGTKKMDAAMSGAPKQRAPAAAAPGPGGDEWELCPLGNKQLVSFSALATWNRSA